MLVDVVDLLSLLSFFLVSFTSAKVVRLILLGNVIRISDITKIQQAEIIKPKYQAPTQFESVVVKLSGADSVKYNHLDKKNEASR